MQRNRGIAVSAAALVATLGSGVAVAAPSAERVNKPVKLAGKIIPVGHPTAGTRAGFKLTTSVPAGDAITTFTINYGDRTKLVKGKKPPKTAAHVYGGPGTYTVTFTITDRHHRTAKAATRFRVIPTSVPGPTPSPTVAVLPPTPAPGTSAPPSPGPSASATTSPTPSSPSPTQPSPSTSPLPGHLDAEAVAAGTYTTCALLVGGTVDCWGSNGDGGLGDPGKTIATTPTAVPGLEGVTAITSQCALLADTTVKCWGGTVDGPVVGSPTAVPGLSGATALSSDGLGTECALITNGGVACWRIGGTPVSISGIAGAAAISGTCALLGSGGVTCWQGTSPFPVPVAGLAGATAISVGDYSSCAIVTGGAVECWGDNTFGQLGNGSVQSSKTPVSVTGISGATGIAVGTWHACAALASGDVDCWGDNGDLQLGSGLDPDTASSSTPVSIVGIADVSSLSSGYDHSCGLTTSGTVECWGLNGNGELGNGTTEDSATPVRV